MMNYYKSGCSKGDLPFPTAQGSKRIGVELDHSSWTLKRRAQQRAIELIFVSPSKPVSEECLSSWPSSSEPTSFRNTASFGLSLCSSEADSGLRDAVWVHCSSWFFILCDVCSQTLVSLTCFSHFSPCLFLPDPTSRKPREIDKQQDRGNWAILFLLRELYFAAFIWKLSFSTSLGKSSHRPMTPKCLCWSIVLVSYWHVHWQLKLSTGIKNGSQLQSVQAAWEAGKAPALLLTL